MKYSLRHPLYILALAGFIAISWLATNLQPRSAQATDSITVSSGKDPIVEDLVPSDMEKRKMKYAAFTEERTRRVIGLLNVIRNISATQALEEYDFGQRAYAIRMLGNMRAEEATILLMDIIDTDFSPIGTTIGGNNGGIVVQALVNIGNPASHKAVEYLAKDKSSIRAPLYVYVIAQVEGAELGKVMVQMAADKEKDPTKKTRLTAAIKLFDKDSKLIP